MAQEPADEQYITIEARIASFNGPQAVAKGRRTSTASTRGGKGALTWPHRALKPQDLADAGFYYNPRGASPDNVRCFLCHKELDGWEDDDNPVAEHLKHSPGCGWAISAAVYHEVDKSACSDDPRLQYLVDARKATFAGMWPYEGKKGWKCKVKQLVEAGWVYTPSLEADDMTTCVYCHLSLDGWEAGDKPFDEHQRRAPDCKFFDLINRYPAPKKPRGKAARASKGSRASIQSVATTASDAPSASELMDDADASILTVTSVATAGGRKMKAKKAPAAKGRKTRTKKQEPVEDEGADPMDEDMPPPPPPKTTRGKKRGSTEMDDSVLTISEAPAPKKRNTGKTRSSTAVDDSVITTTSVDIEMADAPAPKPAVGAKKKGRVASKGRGRKASAASMASTASTASLRAPVPDDDEIDRQLQADLDRPMEDEAPPPPPKTKGKRTASRKVAAPPKEVPEPNGDYAMFDPAPAQHDDEIVDAELQALEQEMSVHQSAKEITIPKKGRKTGPRKASKQTKKQQVEAEVEEPTEPEPEPEVADETVVHHPTQDVEETAQDPDVSTASNGTVVKGSNNRSSTGKRGRGRPPKKSNESIAEASAVPTAAQPFNFPAPPAMQIATDDTATFQAPSIPGGFPEHVFSPPPAVPTPPLPRKALPALPDVHRSSVHRTPTTPRAKDVSHAPSAKQATVSPSPSPQSSDAENHPPSSKPPASSATRHGFTPLAAVCTPVRGKAGAASPTRPANVIGNVRSAIPWTAVDVEMVFADKENDKGVEITLPKGSDLTSPEAGMTVEEWLHYTAGQAEKKLRHESEGMVSAFEREGARAMRVLEELVVD